MNEDQQPYTADYPGGPLPNRLTRGTLVGCVGLAGVLALPVMLFLPLETWGLPRWAFLLAQLVAFSALGGGIWLLARVPSSARVRSNDPLHPLTARGAAPVLERPAYRANRIGFGAVWGLLALSAAGFVLAAFDFTWSPALPVGMALVALAGLALAVYGLCIAFGRLAPPATRWVRMPATSRWLPQGGSMMLLGLTLLGWALLVALEAGFIWGAIGLVALLLGTLFLAPVFRQLPANARQTER
ncbi:MAG TPA: hypothetical protein VFQ32_07490 [Ktedonobacterales bacterium]|nr:hypothetical protein [Ktedonobacterales bacterium]